MEEACKKLDTFRRRFCKKLMFILNSAANGFATMQLDNKSRRGKCKGHLVQYWNRIVCLDIEGPLQQWYGWQNSSNMNVRSWAMELKEELYNIGLAFVWTKQQECNLMIIITKIVKDKRNERDTEKHILAILSEKSSLTLCGEMNFFGVGNYI